MDKLEPITEPDEIKQLISKFSENGFYISPYNDQINIWDKYKLLERRDLQEGRLTHISSMNNGMRCHVFLTQLCSRDVAIVVMDGNFYRCESMEKAFHSDFYCGTIFDGELIGVDDVRPERPVEEVIFLVFDVLCMGGRGISETGNECVDVRPYPLVERIEFATLAFESDQYYASENGFCKFQVQEYYHISEFENLVLRRMPKSKSILFQTCNFHDPRFIYHIQTVNIPERIVDKDVRHMRLVKDKYPGIWCVYDELVRGEIQKHYLYVPRKYHYERLRTIRDHTLVPCVWDCKENMWALNLDS